MQMITKYSFVFILSQSQIPNRRNAQSQRIEAIVASAGSSSPHHHYPSDESDLVSVIAVNDVVVTTLWLCDYYTVYTNNVIALFETIICIPVAAEISLEFTWMFRFEQKPKDEIIK